MSFIVDIPGDAPVEEFRARYRRYAEYLESIKDQLPPPTYKFATAEWHYNPRDPRCPHDAWVEHVTITEIGDGAKKQQRHTDMQVRLLGAYHDGCIELSYKKVHSYDMQKHNSDQFVNRGHDDWLVDEIRLSEDGAVVHEIQFRLAHWTIICEGISYEWQPFDAADRGSE